MYEEASFIARCCDSSPLRVQWLYKDLVGVNILPDEQPELVNYYAQFNKDTATYGSGESCREWKIEHEVGLDWLKQTLQNKIWAELYNSERITASSIGQQQITNAIKRVLEYATQEGLITSFQIKNSNIRNGDTYSINFTCNLMHSILGVNEVSGVITY